VGEGNRRVLAPTGRGDVQSDETAGGGRTASHSGARHSLRSTRRPEGVAPGTVDTSPTRCRGFVSRRPRGRRGRRGPRRPVLHDARFFRFSTRRRGIGRRWDGRGPHDGRGGSPDGPPRRAGHGRRQGQTRQAVTRRRRPIRTTENRKNRASCRRGRGTPTGRRAHAGRVEYRATPAGESVSSIWMRRAGSARGGRRKTPPRPNSPNSAGSTARSSGRSSGESGTWQYSAFAGSPAANPWPSSGYTTYSTDFPFRRIASTIWSLSATFTRGSFFPCPISSGFVM
jgi:hypothetical protein